MSTAKEHMRQAGYTLIELLVVIAIVALIAGLAVPFSVRVVEDAQLRADGRKIATALRHTQRNALTGQSEIRISDLLRASEMPLARGAEVTLFNGQDIVYYADGTTSGGKLTLHERARQLDVAVAWMTGAVTFQAVP